MSAHQLHKDEETLVAVAMLSGTPEFRLFMRALDEERSIIRASIESQAETGALQRIAGAASALTEIIDAVNRVHEVAGARRAAARAPTRGRGPFTG